MSDDITDEELNFLLEGWDQSSREIQRKTMASFVVRSQTYLTLLQQVQQQCDENDIISNELLGRIEEAIGL